MTQTKSQPALEHLYAPLKPILTQPAGLMIIAALISLAGLALARGSLGSRRGTLATGRRGGRRELGHAKRLCLEQMETRDRAKIGLTINSADEQNSLFFPDLQPGALVVGSPGTGKTFSVINPMLRSAIRAGHGMILFDWKYPDQASELIPYAASHGYTVKVFAPGYAESQIYNPLDSMDGPDDLLVASEIAKTLKKNTVQDKNIDAFFDDAGTQLLEAAIALAKGSDFPDLLMAQAILSLPDLRDRLLAANLSPQVKSSIGQFIAGSGSAKTAAGILANALAPLNPFIKGKIAESFCGDSTIDLDICDRTLLVLGMNRLQSEVCAPLISVCLNLVTKSNLSKPRDGSLVLGLDEMPTIRIKIADWLTRFRSEGLCALIGCQNIGQLEKGYGKEVTKSIIGGTPTKFFFNPNELETAKTISEYMGDEDVQFRSNSRGYSTGKRSYNASDQLRTKRIFEAQNILKLRRGRCVTVSPGYCSSNDAYIPITHTIRVSRSELNSSQWSKETWKSWTYNVLLEQAPDRAIDLEARQQLAEQLFPLPEAEEDEPKTLADMKA